MKPQEYIRHQCLLAGSSLFSQSHKLTLSSRIYPGHQRIPMKQSSRSPRGSIAWLARSTSWVIGYLYTSLPMIMSSIKETYVSYPMITSLSCIACLALNVIWSWSPGPIPTTYMPFSFPSKIQDMRGCNLSFSIFVFSLDYSFQYFSLTGDARPRPSYILHLLDRCIVFGLNKMI